MINFTLNKTDVINQIKENEAYSPKDFEEYNCAAYALGLTDWVYPVNPYEEKPEDVAREFGSDDEEISKSIADASYAAIYDNPYMMQLVVKRLLSLFDGLRLIKDFSEVKEDEYGIVYATNSLDFHFGRYDNGILSHKTGSEPPCVVDDIEKIFETDEELYDSERYFFAMKKDYKLC